MDCRYIWKIALTAFLKGESKTNYEKKGNKEKRQKKHTENYKLCNKNPPKTQVNSFTAEDFVVQMTVIVNF